MAIVILKAVRLSYPDLWKPGKPMQEGDTPKYGGQVIHHDGTDNATTPKNAFVAAAQETFGENWQAIVGAMEKSKKCIRKGNENITKDGAIRDGYKDKLYVVARKDMSGGVDPRVRDAFEAMTRQNAARAGASAVVVLTPGQGAAVVRSVMAGLILLTPHRGLIQVFASTDQACAWLASCTSRAR